MSDDALPFGNASINGSTSTLVDLSLRPENGEEKSKSLPPKLQKLTEFPLWKTRMILHFRAENTWSIVSRVEARPAGNDEAALAAITKYNIRAAKAFADLLKCLGENFLTLAATFETVSEAWDELLILCEVSNSQKIYSLQSAIDSFEFSEPATSSLVKLKTLFRELEKNGGTYSSSQKAVKLLSQLPSEYSELSKTIKTTDSYRI